MIVCVLAGTYRQFRWWCEETGFPHQGRVFIDQHGERWQAIYCDTYGRQLCGIRYDAFIRVGTWWEHPQELRDLFGEHERLSKHVRTT
jgi:hypothetical protein